MTTLSSIVYTTSRKPFLFVLIGLLMVFNILMNVPGLPTSTPSMQTISPTFIPFDLQAKGYTVESFTNDLDKLGSKGIRIYKNFMLCDVFFPAIYAFTFSSLVYLVFHKRRNWLKWLFIIPLLTGLLDYVENLFIAIAISGYPSSNGLAVSLASLSTQVKMLFNALLILCLLFSLATWITTLFKKERIPTA